MKRMMKRRVTHQQRRQHIREDTQQEIGVKHHSIKLFKDYSRLSNSECSVLLMMVIVTLILLYYI